MISEFSVTVIASLVSFITKKMTFLTARYQRTIMWTAIEWRTPLAPPVPRGRVFRCISLFTYDQHPLSLPRSQTLLWYCRRWYHQCCLLKWWRCWITCRPTCNTCLPAGSMSTAVCHAPTINHIWTCLARIATWNTVTLNKLLTFSPDRRSNWLACLRPGWRVTVSCCCRTLVSYTQVISMSEALPCWFITLLGIHFRPRAPFQTEFLPLVSITNMDILLLSWCTLR